MDTEKYVNLKSKDEKNNKLNAEEIAQVENEKVNETYNDIVKIVDQINSNIKILANIVNECIVNIASYGRQIAEDFRKADQDPNSCINLFKYMEKLDKYFWI